VVGAQPYIYDDVLRPANGGSATSACLNWWTVWKSGRHWCGLEWHLSVLSSTLHMPCCRHVSFEDSGRPN